MSKHQGHTAKKRFGQHFLSDGFVIDAIIDLVDPSVNDSVVEIGPGLGALTLPLLTRLPRMTVIELDRDLADRLVKNPKLTVIQADVLKVDFNAIAEIADGRLRVVGNLPYNVSTPILFHLFPFADGIKDQHFMLQKEVVDRMVASAGCAAYGRLSVMLQARYEMENLLGIGPDCFTPPPRVQSAIVRMVPRANCAWGQAKTYAHLEDLVRVAFSQRRKLLRHTLGPWLDRQGYSGSFELKRRAEEVSVSDYLELALCTLADDS